MSRISNPITIGWIELQMTPKEIEMRKKIKNKLSCYEFPTSFHDVRTKSFTYQFISALGVPFAWP